MASKIVVPSSAEKAMLEFLIGLFAAAVLRFYTNDYQPVDYSELGNFTFAGNLPGQVLANGLVLFDPVEDMRMAVWDEQSHENTGGGPVTAYGYAVHNAAATQIYWAEKLDTPLTLGSGGTINIRPSLFLRSMSKCLA